MAAVSNSAERRTNQREGEKIGKRGRRAERFLSPRRGSGGGHLDAEDRRPEEVPRRCLPLPGRRQRSFSKNPPGFSANYNRSKTAAKKVKEIKRICK
jgi:hypothetical protein